MGLHTTLATKSECFSLGTLFWPRLGRRHPESTPPQPAPGKWTNAMFEPFTPESTHREVSLKAVVWKALLSVLWQTCLLCRAHEVTSAVSFDSESEFSIEWKGFWHIAGNYHLYYPHSIGFFSWAFNSTGIRLQWKYSWLAWAEVNTLLISLTVDKSMWFSCLGPQF